MKRTHWLLLIALVLVCLLGAVAFYWRGPISTMLARGSASVQTAATFFVESITTQGLRFAYRSLGSSAGYVSSAPNKIRILIVPGHEPYYGGTEYKDYTERDIVVEIADKLAALLSTNPRFEVIVARNKDAWNSTLDTYFTQHAVDIEVFRGQQSALMKQHLVDGRIVGGGDTQVKHNSAPEVTALHLYGINKWATENKVSLTLHLHIDDFAGRRAGSSGDYTGFAIYVPDHQYSNANASRDVGVALARRLNAFHATSSLPKESVGVIEDQELIAIGSNNSTDAASLLVEYGYIYEKQFSDAGTRDLAERDYAYATYLGLQDFFNDSIYSKYGTNVLPYTWDRDVQKGDIGPDVYALQAALHVLGFYPPSNKSFNDCPVSGFFGPCTADALRTFQTAHALAASGVYDSPTKQALGAQVF